MPRTRKGRTDCTEINPLAGIGQDNASHYHPRPQSTRLSCGGPAEFWRRHLTLAAHLPGLREVRLCGPREHLHHRCEPRLLQGAGGQSLSHALPRCASAGELEGRDWLAECAILIARTYMRTWIRPHLQRFRGRPQRRTLLLVQGRVRLALPHWRRFGQMFHVRRGRHRRNGCPRLIRGSEGQGLLHVAARHVAASRLLGTLAHGLVHRVTSIPRTPQSRQPPGSMSRRSRRAPSTLLQGRPQQACLAKHGPPRRAPIPTPCVSATMCDD